MKTDIAVRGYSDGDIDTNQSTAPTLMELAQERFSRRQTLFGSFGATATAFLGSSLLAACVFDDDIQAPDNLTVTAGDNATTSAGRSVTLQGAVTGTATSSSWTQLGGPGVELIEVDGTTATFIAPAVPAATELTFGFAATSANGAVSRAMTRVTVNPAQLGFAAVAKNLNDVVTVPAGYSVTVMTRVGDPLTAGVPDYANDGTDTNFAQRIGDHGDALYYYGLGADGTRDDNSSVRGLLVQNHENLNVQYLHPDGPTNVSTGPRPASEAIKEIEAHGLSVMEYRDTGGRSWTWSQDSALNRRITPNTPVAFNGPSAAPIS